MQFIKLSLSLFVLCTALCTFTARAESSLEYVKKTSKLKTLEGRVEEGKKNILKLIEEKNATTDENKRKALIDDIKAEHKNINKELAEYNKLHQEIEYKYPEKGMDLREKFVLKKEQSIEEIERETSVDQQLTEVKRNADKKYAPITGWKPETKAEKAKELTEEQKPADQRKLKLVK